MVNRFRDPKNAALLESAMWTLGHDYADLNHSNDVTKTLTNYLDAMYKHEAGDPAPLENLGGLTAFKGKLIVWLDDGDQSVRAFAAIVAGISGDRNKVPQLLKLMKRPDEDEFSVVYDSGRAATALGLLGAAEYKPDILLLLKSKNEYSRSGAIKALTLLGAKENAKEVAAILTDPKINLTDDTSPIYFLVETGTAKDYKKELVAAMQRRFGSETAKAAMYALVRIKAKEEAPQIAKLLTGEFVKGEAAKALALMGATEYTGKIGAMLDDEDESVRADAALALGILGAKEYAPQLAAIMVNKETFANSYAAAAIIMMDATDYTGQAAKILKELKAQGVYLTEGSFHPIVSEEIKPFIEKVKAAK